MRALQAPETVNDPASGSSDHSGDSGPFIIGTPILEPRYFFGRQRILRRLFDLLRRHPLQNAAIVGQRRSGKSSLLHYLRTICTTPSEQLRPGQKSDWLPQPERYCWVFVDFQDSRWATPAQLYRYLLESMQLPVPDECDLDQFTEVVSDRLQRPTIVLMDELGKALNSPELDDRFWEGLRSLTCNSTRGQLGFVLAAHEHPTELARTTGHSSPFFNIFGYTATLGPLEEAEARELIASSPIPFAAEDVEWILQQSGRWPLLLQLLGWERLFNLEHGITDEDWQTEGLQRIQPFRHLLHAATDTSS